MAYQILLVEDNKDIVSLYEKAIADQGVSDNFSIVNASNKHDAEECLKNGNFDIAIMDLKLPRDSEDHDSDPFVGVSLLKETLSKHLFPIVVVTATPGVIDGEEDEIPDTLKVMAKEAAVYSEVAEYLDGLQSLFDILPGFSQAKNALEKDFNKTFWDLFAHWNDFERKFNDKRRVPEVMKRHITHYLVEKWTAEEHSGLLHHSEFYTHPPFRKDIYTGDIVQHENREWIVVTAPCDLSNNDLPDEITLLECSPVNYADKKHKSVVTPFRKEPPDTGKRNGAMNQLKGFFSNAGVSRHYLPSWSRGTSPHYIEFKKIKTVPYAIANNLEVLATLNSHFMPYVMQRYGAYVSRLGQPDIDADDYLAYLLTKVPDD